MTGKIERLPSLAALGGRYTALLCDLWGCYHDGLKPYPAAVAALRAFRAGGGIVLLLTNAPRPVLGVERFLAGIGAPDDTHDGVLSSGEVCLAALRAGRYGTRLHYVGPDRDLGLLAAAGLSDTPLDEAEALLCTGLRDDRAEGPEDYAEEIAHWRTRGLPMLCANPDIIVDRGTERLFCAGALAAAYAAAGGEVHYFGKPHAAVYAAALARLSELAGRPVAPSEVLAAGDGIATDVRGARAAGIDGLFVTGGIAAPELGADPLTPDPARLERFLAAHGERPAYWMPRLA
ncbi:MAG: TIGR01459 family HAD-type hydrolase [Pikeienuella sp.]